jgi:hypothetical protein
MTLFIAFTAASASAALSFGAAKARISRSSGQRMLAPDGTIPDMIARKGLCGSDRITTGPWILVLRRFRYANRHPSGIKSD